MAKLIFCDTDKELQRLMKSCRQVTIADGYDPDKIDIIHTASNPSFSMGGGRDGYLASTYGCKFNSELEKNN